jgi:CarD family transcriptional regulator
MSFTGGLRGPRMNFQVGDKVVYPNQGVGTVENITFRTFGATREPFYLLRFGSNSSMTVVVPCSNAANIGLRRVTQEREISRLLHYLSSENRSVTADWKSRYKENTVKMQSNDPLKIAEVLKSLLCVHSGRTLSFREKRMLDCARRVLTSEIATSAGVSEPQALSILQNAFNKAGLALRADA